MTHVVVLGGGSTGEHFVGALRRLDGDAAVTLVESRLVGGECSYYACMPTKTMLRAAELSASLSRAPGLKPERPEAAGVWEWRDWMTSEWDDAGQLGWLESQRDGFVRLFADAEERVLVGAVAVGPQAAEWLGQLTLAVRAATPLEVLLDTIQPYPTFSEGVFFALRELADALA